MSTLDRQQWDQFAYCPACADIYGEGLAWDATLIKVCGPDCPSSAPLRAKLARSPHHRSSTPGLHGAAFAICSYCQVNLITSGSRWSTYYCEECRPLVLQVNDLLDHLGQVTPPIGGHSLQHSWRHSKPFLAAPVLRSWRARNLRRYWEEYEAQARVPSPNWRDFGAFIAGTKRRGRFRDFAALIDELQEIGRDVVMEAIGDANRRARSSEED